MEITVGFLTARKLSINIFRYLLSKLIELFQGKYVHTFIVYPDNGVSMVRDMGLKSEHSTFDSYTKKYGKRIEIIKLKVPSLCYHSDFIYYCKNNNSKYEYKNLVFFQVIHRIFGVWIGGDTTYRRICSEDTARCLNVLIPGFVSKPDSISPTELYKKLEHYNLIANRYLY